MPRYPLLTAFGYDASLLSLLSRPERQRLAAVASGSFLSLLLVAWPAAYTMWLVEHSLWLAFGVGIAAFLLTLNLLRVVTAGGGVRVKAPGSAVRSYRPGLAPEAFLLVLGGLFAQPAQLPLHASELNPRVDVYRAELVAAHARRAEVSREAAQHYRAELARCDFVVKRLTLLWGEPNRAARFTLFYCLLVLLPSFFRQFVAIDALRAYELLRYRSARVLLAADNERTARQAVEALGRFSSYERDAARPATLPGALLAEPRRRAGQLSLKWRAAP
ncbi:MAG TPA: hypothetical protein VGK73_10410 [Polyangiaceae bacterium]